MDDHPLPQIQGVMLPFDSKKLLEPLITERDTSGASGSESTLSSGSLDLDDAGPYLIPRHPQQVKDLIEESSKPITAPIPPEHDSNIWPSLNCQECDAQLMDTVNGVRCDVHAKGMSKPDVQMIPLNAGTPAFEPLETHHELPSDWRVLYTTFDKDIVSKGVISTFKAYEKELEQTLQGLNVENEVAHHLQTKIAVIKDQAFLHYGIRSTS